MALGIQNQDNRSICRRTSRFCGLLRGEHSMSNYYVKYRRRVFSFVSVRMIRSALA